MTRIPLLTAGRLAVLLALVTVHGCSTDEGGTDTIDDGVDAASPLPPGFPGSGGQAGGGAGQSGGPAGQNGGRAGQNGGRAGQSGGLPGASGGGSGQQGGGAGGGSAGESGAAGSGGMAGRPGGAAGQSSGPPDTGAPGACQEGAACTRNCVESCMIGSFAGTRTHRCRTRGDAGMTLEEPGSCRITTVRTDAGAPSPSGDGGGPSPACPVNPINAPCTGDATTCTVYVSDAVIGACVCLDGRRRCSSNVPLPPCAPGVVDEAACTMRADGDECSLQQVNQTLECECRRTRNNAYVWTCSR